MDFRRQAAYGASMVRVLARVILLGILGIAIYRAVLVAWADFEFRLATPAGVQNAERLMPAYELYSYTNALMLEQADPTSPEIEREFARAVAVNPRYSDALMAWSVELEMSGDEIRSEQLLLQARQSDRLARPAWALANFYYRQGNTDRLLAEARESLRIIGVSHVSEGRFSINPIYDLCWKSGANADTILAKGIPDIPIILGSYLSFVLHTGRGNAGPAIVARMMPTAEPGEMFFLRPYLEDLLARGQVSLAAQTWKQLYEKHIVPYRGPDIEKAIFLTNGSLDAAPLDYGFDWRRLFPESVQFNYLRLEHSYRFDFDGTEPEQFGLLVQIVTLQPNRSYNFQALFVSDMDPEPSGLRWSMHDHKTGQQLRSQESSSSNRDSTRSVMTFTTPPGMDSGDLTLSYQRQPGTARLRGYYELLHADLQVAR